MQHEVLVVLADVGVREAAGGAEPADRAVEQLEQAVGGDPGVDRRIEVTLGDALLEDPAHVAVHLHAHLHHDGAPFLAEEAHVALGDGGVLRMVRHDRHPALDEAGEPGGRVGGACGLVLVDGGEAARVTGDAQRVEEVLLAVDVVVEAPPEDAHSPGDVLDPGGLVPLLVEDLPGGVEDLGPPLGIDAALRDRGRCRRRWILLHDHGWLPSLAHGAPDAKP